MISPPPAGSGTPPDACDNPGMPESIPPRPTVPRAQAPTPSATSGADKVLCDRCGAEMYRMHAVWRCPACGFKTDCCGW
jgi:hypothetical protein